ncbi:hypothetical protein OS493_035590 [Desmophyllum pertusum]|uniref:Uncharacterized protein n=1 Tax=Desmophyllum pertusum TaxID=174260 RepID=A0A9W9ZVT2_9CNID|nr:hypothetical protein OS493_035590 [Desmophyllum pertusum]
MAALGLALTNVCLGMAGITAGIGFGVAEHKKMDELNTKSDTLKTAVTTAGNLYDHIYYLVAVNAERIAKLRAPSKTLVHVLGYVGDAAGLGAGLLQVVRYFRNRKAKGEEPPPSPEEPFQNVPLDGEEIPVIPEVESSFSKTPKLDKAINGLNIAGIVFGVAGLALQLGWESGRWTS